MATNDKNKIVLLKTNMFHVPVLMTYIAACDNDHSWTLSAEEVFSEDCSNAQTHFFGQSLDQAAFDFIDANKDEMIDAQEIINAAVAFFSHSSYRPGEGIDYTGCLRPFLSKRNG